MDPAQTARAGRAPGARLGILVLLLLAVAAAGCSSDRRFRSRKDEELELEALRELIAQNTLEPVTEMEGDDPYAGIKPDMSIGPGTGADAPPAPEGGAEPEPDDGYDEEFPENPFVEFGRRIVVHDDGRLTKIYPMRPSTGQQVVEWMREFAPAPFKLYDPANPVQELDTVRMDVKEGFDTELFQSMRNPVMTEGQAVKMSDWLMVTAVPELLRDFEYLMTLLQPKQIEIEAKIVEVTTTDGIDIGVRQLDPDTPIFDLPDHTLVKSIGFNFPNTVDGTETLLTLGAVHDGMAFNAIFEALSTYENVSINSHPKVAVREGAQASIVNTLEIPFFNITGINPSGNFSSAVSYKEVGVRLFVIPRIVGTNTIALNIDIEASQAVGTAVSFTAGSGNNTSIINNPVLSKRAAQTTVYLQQGQAVVIGGLISERTTDRENKLPLIGDIPILGWLFRSTQKVKETQNVLFFIRPRILEGSDLNRPFE